MGFGCGRDAGYNDAVSEAFSRWDYSELGLFSSYKQPWLPAVTSLAGKITINKAQGGKGKGRQRTAAGDSTTGRGRAEQEQVHRVERAFCSFPFHCQIALQQRVQNATRPPGSPSWSSTRLTERRRAGAMLQLVQSTNFISLQLLLIDVTQSSWISFVSPLRSRAAAPRPAKKETRQKPRLQVALLMTAERRTLT